MSLAIGVDLGGSTVRAVVVDLQTAQLVDAAKQTLPASRALQHVIEATAALVQPLLNRNPSAQGRIGVGLAAMLRGPWVLNAPNLGWRQVDFGTPLAAALKRPVRLVNDLSAAAWGERSAGSAKGASDTFTVFVGTGVGSAIIAADTLIAGATQVAGELGHLKIVSDGGRRCGCGQEGCLEAYMGGANLEGWMREEGLAGAASRLESLAVAGDATAQRLYDFAVGHLALAIANQVTLLNPAVLVLGGGVLNRCPGMVARIRHIVSQRSTAASTESLTITMATLGDEAGAIGAAFLS